MDDAALVKRLDYARLVLYDSIEAEDDKYAKRDLEAAYETVELVKGSPRIPLHRDRAAES